ncbi:MAG: 23S rRNA (uracil(1939)-C(5))-methyltransferase RlmD [Clostridiales bacterium]|nr:23S rRNA (uracil(1939)-C(5))-methyltransferase RlmD [Clostridiales bacterium]
MLSKNQQLPLVCHSLGSNFQGICHHEGMVVFVSGLLPEEQALCQILKVKKRFAYAKVVSLISSSPFRAEPPCAYYPKCGGCSGQHMTYPYTLHWKTQQVKECFSHIAGVDIQVQPTLGMNDPWQYRNKTAMPIGGEPGAVVTGFYAPRSHRIIDIEQCLVSQHPANQALQSVKAWANQYQVAPYNEQEHSGLLRHLFVRVSKKGKTMVALISKEKDIPFLAELIASLQATVQGLACVGVIHQPKATNVILGDHYTPLWGEERLEDHIFDQVFSLSPLSFFQINPLQTETLYRLALAYADLKGDETVADLYCGAGTISLLLATKAKKVLGIEQVPSAVEDAKENAIRNGISNVEFHLGDAEKVLPELVSKGFSPDVVVVDPPRKGMDEVVVHALIHLRPKRIVYISCDPATQARDTKILLEGGYTVTACQPVDMFCWTGSIENILRLEAL